jgi:uncharacterized protein YegP (UPF0339 family)
MFVRSSTHQKVKDDLAHTKTELNVTQETRKRYATAIRKYMPWFFVYGELEATEQPEAEYYFQLYSWKPEGGARTFCFYICSSGNNKSIMKSEEYNSKRNAMEAIERLMVRLGSTLKPVIYDSGMNRLN